MKTEMLLVVGLSTMVVGVGAGAIVDVDSRTASNFLFFKDGLLAIVNRGGVMAVVEDPRTASMMLKDRRLDSPELVKVQ